MKFFSHKITSKRTLTITFNSQTVIHNVTLGPKILVNEKTSLISFFEILCNLDPNLNESVKLDISFEKNAVLALNSSNGNEIYINGYCEPEGIPAFEESEILQHDTELTHVNAVSSDGEKRLEEKNEANMPNKYEETNDGTQSNHVEGQTNKLHDIEAPLVPYEDCKPCSFGHHTCNSLSDRFHFYGHYSCSRYFIVLRIGEDTKFTFNRNIDFLLANNITHKNDKTTISTVISNKDIRLCSFTKGSANTQRINLKYEAYETITVKSSHNLASIVGIIKNANRLSLLEDNRSTKKYKASKEEDYLKKTINGFNDLEKARNTSEELTKKYELHRELYASNKYRTQNIIAPDKNENKLEARNKNDITKTHEDDTQKKEKKIEATQVINRKSRPDFIHGDSTEGKSVNESNIEASQPVNDVWMPDSNQIDSSEDKLANENNIEPSQSVNDIYMPDNNQIDGSEDKFAEENEIAVSKAPDDKIKSYSREIKIITNISDSKKAYDIRGYAKHPEIDLQKKQELVVEQVVKQSTHNQNIDSRKKTVPEYKATPKKGIIKDTFDEVCGVEIITLKPGTGFAAKNGDNLRVTYKGTLENGKIFDICLEDSFCFKLGAGKVIRGWDLGLVGIKVGEKRKLVITPEYGYGRKKVGPIPANSKLTFEITLEELN